MTDKNGTQTKHWVRTTKELPKQKPGAGQQQPQQAPSHVAFKNGEHQGHGKVIASGEHGHTVQDAAGGTHRVPHETVTHEWHGDEAPDGAPEQDDKGATVEPSSLFDKESVQSLPDKVSQPAKSWDELVEKGTEGLDQFRGMMGKIQKAMGLKSGMKPEDITPEQWENDEGFMFIAPLKGEKRAKEKVESDYGGDWSQLRDIVRGTISVPTMADVKKALDNMKAAGLEIAQKPKNRFEKPTGEGYRDLMTFVKLPNGMVAELQIHTKAMTLAKEKGHKDYEITRSLQGKYGEAEPSDQWADEDHTKFYDAVKRQKQIYNDAWDKSNGTKPETLIKSEQSDRLVLLFRRVQK